MKIEDEVTVWLIAFLHFWSVDAFWPSVVSGVMLGACVAGLIANHLLSPE